MRGPLTLLVNNAGGALGLDPIERGDIDQWRRMYETNVIGTLRVTKALLPTLEASGRGTVVIIGSTAGLAVYENGGGYVAAKHAETALAQTLRLELCGRPVRVVPPEPGPTLDQGMAQAHPAGRRRRLQPRQGMLDRVGAQGDHDRPGLSMAKGVARPPLLS